MMGYWDFLFLIFFFKGCSTSTFHEQSYCPAEESSALLEFKESFTIDSSASGLEGAYPKVLSWKPSQGGKNTSCCTWDGVECDEQTGHVIGLDLRSSCLYGFINSNSPLFRLVHLQRLDLADNHFNSSQIPASIRNFPRLTHLDLSASMFSGRVPSEISQLAQLSLLNLSSNTEPALGVDLLKLDGSDFRSLVQNLTNLQHLLLRFVDISSQIPESMANLSFLTTLDLHQCELFGDFPVTIFHLQNLESLYLRDNHDLIGNLPEFNQSSRFITLDIHGTGFSGNFPSSIGKIASLKKLDVATCPFSPGLIPSSLGNLRELTYLDLSWLFKGPIPDSFANLTKLTVFRMSSCRLTGPIPSWLGNFSKLTFIEFSYNRLSNSIPASFSNLTNLEWLDLHYNLLLSGNLPSSIQKLDSLTHLNLAGCHFEGLVPSFLGKLRQLTFLDLSWSFGGPIPDSFANLTELTFFWMYSCKLTGPIPSWLGNFSKLTYLDFSFNGLNSPIPASFSNLKNLEWLYLQNNQLNGKVDFQLFQKLKKLSQLELSWNKLDFISKSTDVNASNVPQFTVLNLKGCNITEFPQFLKYQNNLLRLDLFVNNIHGELPKWMFNVSTETLRHFSLESNHLSGQFPVVLPWVNLQYFSVAFNNFHGPLPVPVASTICYRVRENSFTGEVSPLSCNTSSLQILDLAGNSLSGMIPQCFKDLSSLQGLDLSNNNFSGIIPQFLGNFSDQLIFMLLSNNSFHGHLPQSFTNKSNLRLIDVSYNKLQGPLPRSLVNCVMLESLILSNNNLSDIFPIWLRNLPELKILAMRHNVLLGVIGRNENNQQFPKLRVLDISHNNFTGEFRAENIFSEYAMRPDIPANESTYIEAPISLNPYQGSFSVGYDSSITVMSKGVDRFYSKVHKAFAVIDISSNKFEGKIDEWIGNLKGLIFLNVSNNLLTGRIPSSLGRLMHLESLDLSNNQLSGEIPQPLAQLTFLAELNVSHNNLTGPIPSGTQLQGFDVTSYEGNSELCGDPLPKKCGKPNTPAQPLEENDSDYRVELDWKFMLAGFGSGLVVGVVLADLAITRRPELFLEMVGRLMGLMEWITSYKRFGR